MSDASVIKEIRDFIGDFREWKGQVNTRLENIEENQDDMTKSLTEGNKAFEKIRLNCVKHEENNKVRDKERNEFDARIKSLERDGIPKKQRDQLNATSILSGLNLLFNFLLQWRYGIGVATAAGLFLWRCFS